VLGATWRQLWSSNQIHHHWYF